MRCICLTLTPWYSNTAKGNPLMEVYIYIYSWEYQLESKCEIFHCLWLPVGNHWISMWLTHFPLLMTDLGPGEVVGLLILSMGLTHCACRPMMLGWLGDGLPAWWSNMAAMAGKSISMFQGKRKAILQIFGILLPSWAEDPKSPCDTQNGEIYRIYCRILWTVAWGCGFSMTQYISIQ